MYAEFRGRENAFCEMASMNSRKDLIATDGGLESEFALKFYASEIRRDGDKRIFIFCPQFVKFEARGLYEKKHELLSEFGKLALEENQKVERDMKLIKRQLQEYKLDGDLLPGGLGLSPSEAVLGTASDQKVDMIVMGSKRLTESLAKVTGSTKSAIVQKATVPVLVCKPPLDEPSIPCHKDTKRIAVVASDGELHANEALKFYCRNIYRSGDFVSVFYNKADRPVVKKGKNDIGSEKLANDQRLLDESKASMLRLKLKDLKVNGDVTIGDNKKPCHEAIIEFAKKQGAYLIVMGSRGLGSIAKSLVTSVSDQVSTESPVSVLVFKD